MVSGREDPAADHVPVGVRIVVHEPAPVIVHVHGPGLVVLAQHGILEDINACHAKGRVRVVIVTIDRELPVMEPFGKARFPQHNPVIVAVAGDSEVVIRKDDVSVGRGGIERKPSNCNNTNNSRLVWRGAGLAASEPGAADTEQRMLHAGLARGGLGLLPAAEQELHSGGSCCLTEGCSELASRVELLWLMGFAPAAPRSLSASPPAASRRSSASPGIRP